MESDRLGYYILSNPSVKLKKGEQYQLTDIDSITIGQKYPVSKGLVVFDGQSGSRFSKGDTIMARITPCLENGKIAMYNNEEDSIGSTELFVFRGKEGFSINEFVYYFFKQNWIRNYAANSMTGASGRQRADIKFIQKAKVQFPPLPTQQKIASILSAYDSQIENNQKRIKLLEQMAENLYKEWFVRFRFPGYEGVEFEGGVPKGWNSQAGHNKKPKGWDYGELKKLGSFARGKNITSSEMIEGEVPVISAGLEPSGYHNIANVSGPCLTISSSGANAGYLKYNLTDIWAADCSYYNNPNNIWFVYSVLKYLQPVISNMQCGSAQPHVYPKDVNRLCVVLPPQSLVKTFNQQCQVIFDEILNVNKQIDTLTIQRDLLLPRLMSGKLEVKA